MTKWKSCCVLLVCAMALVPAHAKDARPNSAILDRGVLTQASELGVLRLDVASAQIDVRYADGRVYRDSIPLNRRGATDALIQTPFWILGGAAPAGKTPCSDESRMVADVLSMLTRTCADGQSALCTNVRETLGSALAECNDCLSGIPDPTPPDGVTGVEPKH